MHYMFSVEDAEKYGLEEAIIIYNFKFWIIKNIANNKNNYDGRTWTYNSVNAFTKLFPFWSRRQIDRIIKSLIDKEVLITGNYNKIAYDRTLWYAFKDESLFLNGEIDFPKRGNGIDQTGTPIPDINTDEKQNKKILNKKNISINDPLFEIFWNKYDKKVGKDRAFKFWSKLTSEEKQKAIDMIPVYHLLRPDPTYRLHPERYLSNRTFDEEILLAQKTKKKFRDYE